MSSCEPGGMSVPSTKLSKHSKISLQPASGAAVPSVVHSLLSINTSSNPPYNQMF